MRTKSVGRQKMVDTRPLKVKAEEVKFSAKKGPRVPGGAMSGFADHSNQSLSEVGPKPPGMISGAPSVPKPDDEY